MKRKLVSLLVTLGLLTCAPAFAWIDPGVNEGYDPRPQALSLEQEMRDLRIAAMRERAARVQQQAAALTFEQEMRFLRAELRAGPNQDMPNVIRLGAAIQNPSD